MSVQKQKTWIFSIIPIVADFARNVVRYDVFVSYSTENKRQANAIKDLVTKYGAIPFMAPFSIEAGADFQEAIQSNIQNARLFPYCKFASFRLYQEKYQECNSCRP